MKETLKNNNECIFSTRHKKRERLDKTDNIRKTLYSEFEWRRDININLLEKIDEISFKIIDRTIYDGEDSPLKLDKSECLKVEIFNKFSELRNSILNV